MGLSMLDFSDMPYRYFPPKRVGPIAALLSVYNRKRFLPVYGKVRAIDVDVDPALTRAVRERSQLLFTPNHPTHIDPYVYFEALRRVGATTFTMAAYDVFLRSKFNAWVMQKLGTFSVDREGSDPSAMKQAAATLTDTRFALTLFPEGNVYLRNDRLTPLHEGAALLATRAVKTLAERGRRLCVAPVAMKYTFAHDVSDLAVARLRELAAAVDVPWRTGASPLDMLRAVGVAALHRNLKHRGIDFPHTDDLVQLVRRAGESVLAQLEHKLEIEPRPKDDPFDRVRRCRRVIHQVRLDESRYADHAAAVTWADDAMLAFRILSYEPGYVAERPTLDRFAETVEKLAEDITTTEQPPLAERKVFVKFAAPIDVQAFVDRFEGRSSKVMSALTAEVERVIQTELDELNARNPMPGGSVLIA